MQINHNPVRIGIVGPCTAGKTTLIERLKRYRLDIRHIAQEHSFAPTMWKKISDPDLLIFLDVSYAVSVHRKKINWTEEEYQEQHNRLRNARQAADFYLLTDDLLPDEVFHRVQIYLLNAGIDLTPDPASSTSS